MGGGADQPRHLSGNVLNLPLRPPAVLARAAASLDLLSGGRVTLGLGARFFWDGIEAMGIPKLTLGQEISALDDVSVFILLGADDPDVVRRFAERVVPGVRKRVAEARA